MSSLEPLKGCNVLPPMLTAEERARRAERGDAQAAGKPKRTRDTGKRFAALNAFVDCTLATMPRTDALVWLVLFRDARGDIAKTAQAYISRRANLCRRTVGMALKRLQARGLVDVAYRGGLNRGLSIYRIRPLGKDAPHVQ
jgi:CRP-like cAMP-binding protein